MHSTSKLRLVTYKLGFSVAAEGIVQTSYNNPGISGAKPDYYMMSKTPC